LFSIAAKVVKRGMSDVGFLMFDLEYQNLENYQIDLRLAVKSIRHQAS